MTSVDRRALLLAGAGTVTVAPLAVFAPAVAGKTRTKTFQGEFTSSDTPDWHYLPFRVPRGVRRISVKYSYQPTETGFGLTFKSSTSGSSIPPVSVAGPAGRGARSG